MRPTFAFDQQFFATVYAGQGLGGQQLGSIAPIVPFGSPTDFTLDFSGQNIQVVEGETYTMSVLCGTNFAATSQPAPNTGGFTTFGGFVNWWFRTNVDAPAAVANARSANLASIAKNANNAVNATNATNATNEVTATTAQALDANATSGLNSFQLRLKSATDRNHGLGYFGGSSFFASTGFAPDGPVLFGNLGGGLGTASGSGNIALRWNNAGLVSIGGPISTANYRLELPNTANPAGQGRANAWVTYSSREYKHDIQTLADPLTTLSRLRGVQFVWNDALHDGTHKHDIGFIAEEVADAIPDLVTRTPEGAATGLDYGKVVPITVEAIKAQQATLVAQREEIAALKARLEKLESLLAAQAEKASK
ncbi:MAG: tail fiber domain-containing protein [Phycisphaerales bacterium]|nr:tail fiber domain-containing protein [Phycisphaerales bacterium]